MKRRFWAFLSSITPILALTISLAGCGIFSFDDDNVNALEFAKELLKGQLNEQGVQKKIDLPIRVNYSITRKPMIDEELLVEFEIITEQAIPIVRFAVVTDEGLDLVSNNFEAYYKGLKTRQIIKHRIKVIPTSENKFYISLYVITEIGDDKRARLIKIPVAIGDYSLSDDPAPR